MSDSYEYWSTANCNDGSWQKGIAYRAMWITKNIYDAKWSRKIRISIRLVFTVLATVSSWWKPSIYEVTKKTADGPELSQENYLNTFLLVYFEGFPCKLENIWPSANNITLNPKPDSNTIPCNQWSNHVQKIEKSGVLKLLNPTKPLKHKRPQTKGFLQGRVINIIDGNYFTTHLNAQVIKHWAKD